MVLFGYSLLLYRFSKVRWVEVVKVKVKLLDYVVSLVSRGFGFFGEGVFSLDHKNIGVTYVVLGV